MQLYANYVSYYPTIQHDNRKTTNMDHVAIMKKEWGLIEKILSGQKKIESRWYMAKFRPWDNIKKDDTVYFKNSGESVTIKANVKKVMQIENLTPKKVLEILTQYGHDDGINDENFDKFYKLFKNKKYCILIFLKIVKKIEPFEIDKSGFGTMSAWITVDNINKIIK